MRREKFPEKIPFRLTRMLTHAMEVSGIEGSFRNTCEISMKVLRENKESLMAVLEAFVYDPLINWRLMQPDVERRGEGTYALQPIYRFLSIRDPPFLCWAPNFPLATLCPSPFLLRVSTLLHPYLRALDILGDGDRATDLVRAAAYPTAPIRKLKADENDILNGTFRDLRAMTVEGLTSYSVPYRGARSPERARPLCVQTCTG